MWTVTIQPVERAKLGFANTHVHRSLPTLRCAAHSACGASGSFLRFTQLVPLVSFILADLFTAQTAEREPLEILERAETARVEAVFRISATTGAHR